MAVLSIDELLRLPAAERLALAEALWDSVLDSADLPELGPEQVKEMERRLAEHVRDPSNSVAWSEVSRDLDSE